MKDAYTKLMVQQHTSEDAAFFEKLENAKSDKKRKYAWNALVASACIILLIPITVLAAGFFSHPVKTAEIHYSREYDKTNIEAPIDHMTFPSILFTIENKLLL